MNLKSSSDNISHQIGRQSSKASKGTVKVETDKGWLRIRFTYQKKRYAFAIGLPDTSLNRKVAQEKARKIELDILSDNFDLTLKKYKPSKTQNKDLSKLLNAESLVRQFINNKAKTISTPRSLEKYQTVLKHLQNFQCRNEKKKMMGKKKEKKSR